MTNEPDRVENEQDLVREPQVLKSADTLAVKNLPSAPPGHDEPAPGQGKQLTRRSRGNVDGGQLQFELEGD